MTKRRRGKNRGGASTLTEKIILYLGQLVHIVYIKNIIVRSERIFSLSNKLKFKSWERLCLNTKERCDMLQ